MKELNKVKLIEKIEMGIGVKNGDIEHCLNDDNMFDITSRIKENEHNCNPLYITIPFSFLLKRFNLRRKNRELKIGLGLKVTYKED